MSRIGPAKGAIWTFVFLALAFCVWTGAETWRNTMRPVGITIHHSAVERSCYDPTPVDVSVIDRIHAKRGYSIRYMGHTYHVGYHYVILPDGTVQPGRPERCLGAHALSHNDTIGICLVGKFSKGACSDARQPAVPAPSQMGSLVSLCRRLLEDHGLDLRTVKLHREFNDQTECPGPNFPDGLLRQRLASDE